MGVLEIIRKVIRRINNMLNSFARKFYVKKLRKSFSNTSLSVFSSNCVGGCMLHDLNARFNSPFVNLFLSPKDYIKFLQDPKKYCAAEFKEIEREYDYPMAMLDDLTIRFVHYASFDEAVATFKRRVERIDFDNLFVIFCEKDGCTYEDLKAFDALPYEHKVVFTHLPYDDIQSAFYIEGFEQEDGVGNVIDWDQDLGKRIYDRFNFAEWLNG